ncbi:MAG: phenylalanine--tRNA ligase beta subunit-related protein [Patescibacteria group bacterium]|jgi:DNA/RNA-binding domain of Phe-tRNA-synthetase-like protein
MIAISIDSKLATRVPRLVLGAVCCSVVVSENDSGLWREINQFTIGMQKRMSLADLPHQANVKALRDGYKSIGKDPTRYRGSAEALARRILQGKGLYQVNTIVDINNLISLKTLHSVGSYNLDALRPPVQFRIGLPGETYKGIGKELINIAELPLFADTQGPFGSPTSDSERSMITKETNNLLMVIISFDGEKHLPEDLAETSLLLQRYTRATNFETAIIK